MFPKLKFDDCQGDIDALVNRRNAIASGKIRSGVTAEELTFLLTKQRIAH